MTVSRGVTGGSPLRWRLRIEDLGGTRLASEWTQIFHHHDSSRRANRLAVGQLHPHEHKLNLSACGGDPGQLRELQAALATSRGRVEASEAELSFTLSEGLSAAEVPPAWDFDNSSIPSLSVPSLGATLETLSTTCSTSASPRSPGLLCSMKMRPSTAPSRGSTLPGPFDLPSVPSSPSKVPSSPSNAPATPRSEQKVASSTPMGGWTWQPSASITVGLVSTTRPFRGEVLVSSCEGNPSKLRGTGCAWRSDGVLLSQHCAPDGVTVRDAWTGRTTPFGVGDEIEVVASPPPDLANVRLFVNGVEVASFPDHVLERAPQWRLAVRVQRSRIAMMEEGDAVGLPPPRRRAVRDVDEHPGGIRPMLWDIPGQEVRDEQDKFRSELLRMHVDDRGRKAKDCPEGYLKGDMRNTEREAFHAREAYHSYCLQTSLDDMSKTQPPTTRWEAKRLVAQERDRRMVHGAAQSVREELPAYTLGASALDESALPQQPQPKGIHGLPRANPQRPQTADVKRELLSVRVSENRARRLAASEHRKAPRP